MAAAQTASKGVMADQAQPTESASLAFEAEKRMRLRAGLTSLVVGSLLLGVKFFAYWHTGSAAIYSDALESIANVVAAMFALGGLSFAARPADREHPYGHGKIEYFSAVFEGGLISFAAALILWYAIEDLIAGPRIGAVDLGLLLTVAAGVVNLLLGWFLVSTGKKANSLTLVADGEHVISDFKTSVGVVLGLILVRLTGLAWLDPAAALLVAVNLAWTGIKLVRHAAGGLLDEEDTELLSRVVAACEATRVAGVIRIHRLRAIRFGRDTHADAHLIVPEFWTVEEAHEFVEDYERRVMEQPGIEGDIVFHTDPCHRRLCTVCDVADCPVRREPFRSWPALTVDEATLTDEAFWRAQMDKAPRST